MYITNIHFDFIFRSFIYTALDRFGTIFNVLSSHLISSMSMSFTFNFSFSSHSLPYLHNHSFFPSLFILFISYFFIHDNFSWFILASFLLRNLFRKPLLYITFHLPNIFHDQYTNKNTRLIHYSFQKYYSFYILVDTSQNIYDKREKPNPINNFIKQRDAEETHINDSSIYRSFETFEYIHFTPNNKFNISTEYLFVFRLPAS